MEWIVFEIILLLCILVFAGIGVWALMKKTPMFFWIGTAIDSKTITDIKKYNKANAIMWFCYCIPFVLSMFIAPYSMSIACIIMGVGAMIGLGVLMFAYEKIKRKYTK